jgi:MFS superfamily sulfate permease-like transporter
MKKQFDAVDFLFRHSDKIAACTLLLVVINLILIIFTCKKTDFWNLFIIIVQFCLMAWWFLRKNKIFQKM